MFKRAVYVAGLTLLAFGATAQGFDPAKVDWEKLGKIPMRDGFIKQFNEQCAVCHGEDLQGAPLGTPLVGAGGDFTSPASYGDVMNIDVWFTKIGRSSCQLAYRLAVEGRTIVEGYERRVFGKGGAGGMQTVPIPEELRPGLEKYFEG